MVAHPTVQEKVLIVKGIGTVFVTFAGRKSGGFVELVFVSAQVVFYLLQAGNFFCIGRRKLRQ